MKRLFLCFFMIFAVFVNAKNAPYAENLSAQNSDCNASGAQVCELVNMAFSMICLKDNLGGENLNKCHEAIRSWVDRVGDKNVSYHFGNLGLNEIWCNEHGKALACARLSEAYYYGKGVERDEAKAKEFAQKACDLWHEIACFIAGVYADRNKTRAKYYFGKSCDLGYAPACDEYKKLKKW
ncbi:hypothetical protein OFO10_06175 [Campylobacter sp. VBCF_06 NA8]|uniref:tetratricopeptide repeat protein n=1 Tax=Campylobacter sp. VBCF_06 NA8 TaxID=2983822 RepID=UPI0022E9B2AE|nr:hypothetical protein [Campylobacter sp. VBCF_06 NA8]MDA3046739.1 hypothetical protein [Campylobacter sp. VBCF_06 NA8]